MIDYKFIPTIQSLNKETLNLKISNSLEQKKQQTISNLISTSSTSTSYLSYGTIGLGTPKLNRVKSLNSLKPIKSNDDKKGEEEQADNELGVEGTKGKGKTIETVGGLLVPGNNRIPQLLRRCSSADSLAAREEAEFNSDVSFILFHINRTVVFIDPNESIVRNHHLELDLDLLLLLLPLIHNVL